MPDFVSSPLLQILKDRGLLDDLQIEEIVSEQKRSGKPDYEVVVDFGLITLDIILQAVAEALGTEVVEIRDDEITPEILQSISPSAAQMNQVFPIAVFGSTVRIAAVDPFDSEMIDQLARTIKKDLQLVIADPAAIIKQINAHYGGSHESVSDVLKEIGADGAIADEMAEMKDGKGTRL